ncbi:putative integral membrane protein (TIGR00698 family) [Agromyces hippuratus]|uniref:Putative integral membrane protein (TIGR00698 family) n=1 Tax=Agromyces hippuratus TaxID=286438 RepID=A0A852WUQ5_9MICO|nr:putative sulfate exporter family transporter [Agromyces hippuratus]NYG21298.1 putative integral membrane protein (TIGR00698 family) [Agromyces hippuratus]
MTRTAPAPASPSAPQAPRSTTARVRARLADLAPGLGLAAAGVAASMTAALLLPGTSALLIAIVLGVLLRNAVPLSPRFEAGLAFAAKPLLRLGVVLLGLQLVLGDILDLGVGVILVVVAIVVIGITSTLLIGRLLGISATQRLLIACGFSICGAAAVAAVDGVIEAEEEEVVTAVALVVIFGTLMIPLIPLAASLLGLDAQQAGMWAGGSIHEVAQVVAVGGAIGGAGLAVAVVVKLARVLMLAPVLAVVSVQRRRSLAAGATPGKRPPIIPLFVVGFIAMVVVRSLGWVPDDVVAGAGHAQTVLLAAAMFALGTGVRFSMFRRVGVRPFALAGASTLIVTGVALAGVVAVG